MAVDLFNWDLLAKLANSNFVTSLLGALAGAWGGAYAAQKIASRDKRREQLSGDISNANSALELAHSAFSTFANLKEQHFLAVWSNHHRQKLAVVQHNVLYQQTGGRIPPLRLQLDFNVLYIPNVQAERLQDAISRISSSSGRIGPNLCRN